MQSSTALSFRRRLSPQMVHVMGLVFLFGAIFLATDSSPAIAAGGSAEPLTVEQGIALRRILRSPLDREGPIKLSPNGKRYVFVLTHGDLEHNGNWLEFMSGTLDSLSSAEPQMVGRLFTASSAVNPLLDRGLRWLSDSETVAFLWDDGKNPVSAVTLNLRSRKLHSIVAQKTNVSNFDVSNDGKVIMYSTVAPISTTTKSLEMMQTGFAVPDQVTLPDLLTGALTGDKGLDLDVFVKTPQSPTPRHISLPKRGLFVYPNYLQIDFNLSPDGSTAIVTAPATQVPAEWDLYEDSQLKREFTALRRAPGEPTIVAQFWKVNVQTGDVHPLWNAPARLAGRNVVWSPKSSYVAVGPTFLPPDGITEWGRKGNGIAIYTAATQRVSVLEPPDGFIPSTNGTRWLDDIDLEITGTTAQGDGARGKTVVVFGKDPDGAWNLRPSVVERGKGVEPPVRVEFFEALNDPPEFVGFDSSGHRSVLMDINPELRKGARLGKVESVTWISKDGKPWNGTLYYPVDFKSGRRYPLVLKGGQPIPQNRFSIMGDDFNMTAGCAEAMAGRNMAVLITATPSGGLGPESGTPREFETVIAGYESAIDHLTAVGLADPEKIGLAGVSRLGDRAVHFLTQSSYRIAAALIADNLDDSYLQYLMMGTQIRLGIARHIGAEPIDEGFMVWRERAPGFNVSKIHTPLRLERDSGGLVGGLQSWEIFSQLRYLQRPVELYFVPDVEHGDHQLTSPAQLRASQEGAVDWFDFWLNKHEDQSERKKEQYTRWRRLRALYEADIDSSRVVASSNAATQEVRSSVFEEKSF